LAAAKAAEEKRLAELAELDKEAAAAKAKEREERKEHRHQRRISEDHRPSDSPNSKSKLEKKLKAQVYLSQV
jgi:hypothetical protein